MKSKHERRALSLVLAIVLCKGIMAQPADPVILFRDGNIGNLVIIGSHQTGNVLLKECYVSGRGNGDKYYKSFRSYSLKLGKQTTGEKNWQAAHNYPMWGCGIQVYDFYAPEDIGTPVVADGFISSALKRYKKLELRYELGLGVSFNWKPYHPYENPTNKAIGFRVNAYLGGGVFMEYKLAGRMAVNAGIVFDHFSCGSTVQPNKGLNIVSPEFNIKCFFQDNSDAFTRRDPPLFYNPKNELILSLFTGVRNFASDVSETDSSVYNRSNFRIHGMTANLARQIHQTSKIGFGVSFSYDNSSNVNRIESPWTNDLQLSIYPFYEFVFSDFSIFLQPCFYLHRNRSSYLSPDFYQKFGFKYHFHENAFAGFSLRAHNFCVADYIEWTIGYRMEWDDR